MSPFPPTLSYFGTIRDITLDLNSTIAGELVQTLFVAGLRRFQSDDIGGFTKIAARLYKPNDFEILPDIDTDGVSNTTEASAPNAAMQTMTEQQMPTKITCLLCP